MRHSDIPVHLIHYSAFIFQSLILVAYPLDVLGVSLSKPLASNLVAGTEVPPNFWTVVAPLVHRAYANRDPGLSVLVVWCRESVLVWQHCNTYYVLPVLQKMSCFEVSFTLDPTRCVGAHHCFQFILYKGGGCWKWRTWNCMTHRTYCLLCNSAQFQCAQRKTMPNNSTTKQSGLRVSRNSGWVEVPEEAQYTPNAIVNWKLIIAWHRFSKWTIFLRRNGIENDHWGRLATAGLPLSATDILVSANASWFWNGYDNGVHPSDRNFNYLLTGSGVFQLWA